MEKNVASFWESRRQRADEARLVRSSRDAAAKLKRAEGEFATAFRAERYAVAVSAAQRIATTASAQSAVLDEFNRRTEEIGGASGPESKALRLFANLGPDAFLAGALGCSGREQEALASGNAYMQTVDELLGMQGLPEDFFDEVGAALRSHREFLGQAAAVGKSVTEWREWMLLFLREAGM